MLTSDQQAGTDKKDDVMSGHAQMPPEQSPFLRTPQICGQPVKYNS
jgi:hypothetical protein